MRNQHILKWLHLVLFVFSAFPLIADGDAGQAGLFLRYGTGGRALGMGRAFVAVADDASGIVWNPAGLVGAKHAELTTMYSNLYYDSQFAHFGFVLPRPMQNINNKLANFLIGPESAVGFGWIGMGMSGFEQRTNTGQLLGDFDIGENGLLFGWAHETVGLWGVFRYGLSTKIVNQNFSGLSSMTESGQTNSSDGWSGGLDVGMTFQPIHAPLLRVVSLKYLMPLKLGLSFQNAVQPKWGGTSKSNRFPHVLRAGLSYQLNLKDWIPPDWGMDAAIKDIHFLLAFDKEYAEEYETGTFFGVEGYFPIFNRQSVLQPRFGLNNQTEIACFGGGLTVPFGELASLRIDYALAMHPQLPSDSRFFMTIQFGQSKDSDFFKKRAQRPENTDKQTRNRLLSILSQYPNQDIVSAVGSLAETADSAYARRYYELTGGLGRAQFLLAEARQLIAEQKVQKAQKKADQATEEYAPLFLQTDNQLSDANLLDYGEALMLAGNAADAVTVMEEVEEETLTLHFMLANAKKQAGDFDGALEFFNEAINQFESEQDYRSMVSLSFLSMGEILMEKRQYLSAGLTFEVLLKNHNRALRDDYPRVYLFRDQYCLDDAQFLSGLAKLLMKDYDAGVADLLQTVRFYPNLEYGQILTESMNDLLDAYKTKKLNELDSIARTLYFEYKELHTLGD